MSTLQQRIQVLADQAVDAENETGVQIAVYRDGQPIVDVVAGSADSRTGRAVTAETPFYTYSMGKAMTAVVTHQLVDRGVFGNRGYDATIAEFWPEFATGGKETATIRHALTHTVGIPGLPADVTPEDLCDWDGICATVAGLEAWWQPGTKTAYHAYTFGFILGELVRRVAGQSISEVLDTEVARPLNVAGELWFRMPVAEQSRLARLEDDPARDGMIPPDSPMWKLAPPAVSPDAEFGNRSDILDADIPAGGKMTARAIARMYAAVLGEVDGVRLVSPKAARALSEVAYTAVDEVFGVPTVWSLGLGVGGPGAEPGTGGWFGMAGAGGTYAGMHPATGTSVAVVKNRLGIDMDLAMEVVDLIES